MKNIIFDVDDTLYNLMEPFEKAHNELMATRTDADCEELFEASRTYSDEAFCMSREGKISEDEEFAYRIQKTYADVGVEVSKENYRIGILTNGTTKNQGKKLETLGLDHWFNPKTMFISDSVGAAKPDVKAFYTVQKEMKLDPEETWFIGDTFEIDVVGAKNSGWHVIWFNHRNRPMLEGAIVPDVEVTSGQELFEYIKKL